MVSISSGNSSFYALLQPEGARDIIQTGSSFLLAAAVPPTLTVVAHSCLSVLLSAPYPSVSTTLWRQEVKLQIDSSSSTSLR